jgi:hypothetical protein
MKDKYELSNIIVERGNIEDLDRPFVMREVDQLEVKEMVGEDLTKSYRDSIKFALTGDNIMYRGLCKNTGNLLFVMGLCKEEGTKIGVPWMLTSKDFKPNIDFIRQSRSFVNSLYTEDIAVLSNYVRVNNTQSIKWLGWLGFQFTPHPYLNNYYQFYKYKE